MKKILYLTVCSAFICLILPLIIVAMMGGLIDNEKKDNNLIDVYFHMEDCVKKINSEEYLTGVVCAEMSAVFENEALKAQAVAARTYTVYKLKNNKNDKYHKGASICTDSTHCQAWTDINEKAEAWGDSAKNNTKKIQNAISETANEVITYNGDVINAVFHSTSSGNTENAKDVWGKDIPYLVSVKSDGEGASPRFKSEEIYTVNDFKKLATENIRNVKFNDILFSDITRTDTGSIKTIKIGNKEIGGSQLRKIYNLRSTNAQITQEGDNIIFSVTGNGHGVGMSQYGANHLAKSGLGYADILKHYYTGVEVSKRG